MPNWAMILTLLAVTSCGGFRLFSEKNVQPEREIASVTMQRLLLEENKSFSAQVDEKLHSLYSYYAIALKNLDTFDSAIDDLSLSELYRSSSYLNLLAVRTQVDDIERELSHAYAEIKEKNSKSDIQKGILLKERIADFARKSPLSYLSVTNLSENLRISLPPSPVVTQKKLHEEYRELEDTKEFQIYEKNIEHLSHLMETEIKSGAKKWKPSENGNGNMTGEEFPSKVWALTFNNGPHEKKTTKILKNLKSRNLKATFFQLASKLPEHIAESKLLRDAGMEIASHSYSHRELNKVGHSTLEKEITFSTKQLEKTLGVNIQFFRLPYGSGMEMPAVRQLIARNNLIHVFWNIDSLDWPPQDSDRIVSRTKRLMKKSSRDSGIILFHEVYDRSVVASAQIMDHLQTDARRTCTLGTIVKDMNEGQKTICSQKSF
ncbi:MAG: polysaccharide deacetylase family protein [Bacteriovoracia bacterium]